MPKTKIKELKNLRNREYNIALVDKMLHELETAMKDKNDIQTEKFTRKMQALREQVDEIKKGVSKVDPILLYREIMDLASIQMTSRASKDSKSAVSLKPDKAILSRVEGQVTAFEKEFKNGNTLSADSNICLALMIIKEIRDRAKSLHDSLPTLNPLTVKELRQHFLPFYAMGHNYKMNNKTDVGQLIKDLNELENEIMNGKTLHNGSDSERYNASLKLFDKLDTIQTRYKPFFGNINKAMEEGINAGTNMWMQVENAKEYNEQAREGRAQRLNASM